MKGGEGGVLEGGLVDGLEWAKGLGFGWIGLGGVRGWVRMD